MEPSSEHIKHLREDFTMGQLHEQDLQADPFKQFELWMSQAIAAQISEVQAMTLSTVTAEHKPHSRIVYLREFDAKGFCFYTNYSSAKGREMETNGNVSLNFFWKELERQVRIDGTVERVAPEQSDAYFDARPYDSKIGAWASAQSSVLSSREELEEKITELKQQFPADQIKRPDFWGGYRVKPQHYEFWQGRKSRLHDRFSYEWQQSNWKIERLSP